MKQNQKTIKSLIRGGAVTALVGFFSLFLSVIAHGAVLLKDSSFVTLPGGKLEVKLDFDQAPPTPKAYTTDNPPRLILDLWGVENDLGRKALDIRTGDVEAMSFAQGGDRLRIVTALYASTGYETFTEGNSLFLVFGQTGSVTKQADNKPASLMKPKNQLQAYDDKTRVNGIDFQRVDGGIGRIVITMTDDQAGLNVDEEGNNVVVSLSGASLNNSLQQRIDVQDFATPVMFVDAMAAGRNTKILVKPGSAPYDYMAYQTGNKLVLDFKPLTRAEEEDRKANQFPYSGEKIDLNFQNVSVRSVLQILAEVAQLNLVVDDAVDGEITLRLKHVPWDQALDIVLKTRGLDKRQIGNVLLVAPAEQIAERERIELESQKQVEELSPLVTDFIQVDFRKASEMRQRIYDAKLVTERGFIVADDQTNRLMVRETAKQLDEIRRTLRQFDTEVSQIMIEARLVTARADYSRELGIRWGFGLQDGNFVAGGSGDTSAYYVEDFPVSGADLPLNVDLGASGTTSSLVLGYATNSFALATELSAMQSEGKIEIVSQPKVITTNGKAAYIKSGSEVPYQTVEDGEVSIEFKDVVLSLDVTPQINPGDRIALELKINNDSIGQTLDNGEISIDTNELETSVVVKDGETVVLGGVYQNNRSDYVYKTPLLGDIPVVGNLFKKTVAENNKEELLIFITPKLVRESLSNAR
jgi:type IV pilus assembly protein PilQ